MVFAGFLISRKICLDFFEDLCYDISNMSIENQLPLPGMPVETKYSPAPLAELVFVVTEQGGNTELIYVQSKLSDREKAEIREYKKLEAQFDQQWDYADDHSLTPPDKPSQLTMLEKVMDELAKKYGVTVEQLKSLVK